MLIGKIKSVVGGILFCLFVGTLAQAQTITTSAGNSTWAGPIAVAVDGAGNQYVVANYNHVVFKVDTLATTTVVAGTMNAGGYSGDGSLASRAQLYYPSAVALDSSGNFYISDTGNSLIRKVSASGIITTVAGTAQPGFSGDGGPAVSAQIQTPQGICVDSAGNIYFADSYTRRVRKIDTSGIINTVAGSGSDASSGDGGPAVLAGMTPRQIAIGPDNSVYIVDTGSYGPRVRKVTSGKISTVAGTSGVGYSGDGGPATSATFSALQGVAVDAMGNIFVTDGYRIRKVNSGGVITTYAGTGGGGYSGDGGPATQATFGDPAGPQGLAVDSGGNLYVADYNNRCVRKITPPALPQLRSTNPAIPAFQGNAGFNSNSYLEIYGTNLAQTMRNWTTSDFKGQTAPTSLDGVSVAINGKLAYVYYVSPTQINVNTPDDTATGPVSIQVTNSLGVSNMGTVTRTQVAPSLLTTPTFLIGGKQYVIAQTPDFSSYIGKPNMLSGLTFVAAKPGDTVVIFALGCGPTLPSSQAGLIASQSAPLMLPYSATVGGVPAQVSFAGIVGGSVGLYQFNIVIPAAPAGDNAISITVGGVGNGQNLTIYVGS